MGLAQQFFTTLGVPSCDVTRGTDVCSPCVHSALVSVPRRSIKLSMSGSGSDVASQVDSDSDSSESLYPEETSDPQDEHSDSASPHSDGAPNVVLPYQFEPEYPENSDEEQASAPISQTDNDDGSRRTNFNWLARVRVLNY